MQSKIKTAYLFAESVIESFLRGESFLRASALTYSTMLTFIPLLLTVFFIVRFLPIYDQMGVNLQQFIILNFVPSFGDQILEYVELFERQAQSLPSYSLVSLGVTVIILLMTVEDTLNASWKIKRSRKMGLSIIMSWLLLLFGPIFLLASIVVSSIIASFEWMNIFTVVSESLSIKLVPFVLSIMSFSLIYYIVPHCEVYFKHAVVGGCVTSILFEMTKKTMGLYIELVPTYSALYGTLTALPFLMLWIYIVWVIFFFGGHVVNTLRLEAVKKEKKER